MEIFCTRKLAADTIVTVWASSWSDKPGVPLVRVPVEDLTDGIAAGAVEPLDGPGDIGERNAVLRVGVQLCAVPDDQPLVRTDRSGGRQHGDVEAAVGDAL